MRLAPFGLDYSLYRGKKNGHSTHSDGLLSPQSVVNKYSSLGTILPVFLTTYGLMISLRQPAFLMVMPSIVMALLRCVQPNFIALAKNMTKTGYGILWRMACRLILPVQTLRRRPQTLSRAWAAGAYVSVAHPEWYNMTMDEAMTVAAADAVEIYNHSCVLSSARGSGIAIADFLLNERQKISFTATDDSHFDLPDFAGGWVMAAAPELSERAIIAALKAGHHYSSTGADFTDISIEDGNLTVHTTPVQSIVLSGEGHLASACHGNKITVARFNLSEFASEWFRITARGSVDQMAWSNPYFKSELGL